MPVTPEAANTKEIEQKKPSIPPEPPPAMRQFLPGDMQDLEDLARSGVQKAKPATRGPSLGFWGGCTRAVPKEIPVGN